MDKYTAIDLMRDKYRNNWNTPMLSETRSTLVLIATTYRYNPKHNPLGFPVTGNGIDGCLPNTLIALIQTEYEYYASSFLGEAFIWENWVKRLSEKIDELLTQPV